MSSNKEQQQNNIPDKKNNKKQKEEELSEEDKALKERIDLYVERMLDNDHGVAQFALDGLAKEVKEATTSMTSLPRPFKFLKNHYQTIVNHYETLESSPYKANLADFLSVLAMTFAEPDKQISLKYLMEGTKESFRTWGYEYLSHLAGDIGFTYNKRIQDKQPVDDLLELADLIIPQFIKNNQETDAIDFMIEVDKIEELIKYVEHKNFPRVYQYLTQSSLFSTDQEEQVKTLDVAFKTCMNLKEYTNALRVAFKLDKMDLIKQVVEACDDPLVKKQLAFNLARQRINYDFEEDEQLQNIVSNKLLSDFYQKLAKDLEVEEPKHPHKIYKTHLEESKHQVAIDSALQNLAHTYVNAFVNLGSRKDALMLNQETDKKKEPWIYKVKNEGLIAAAASLGLIYLWDPENAQQYIDEYADLTDGMAKAGSFIALGLVYSGIKDENDPAKAILEDKINGREEYAKLGSIIGLGMAYAGSAREDILESLIPLIIDTNINVEVSAFAALSAALIFVGKCNEEVGNAILQTLIERKENQLNLSIARFFSIALGLLFMSQQEACEATIEAINIIEHQPTAKYTEICIKGCAYIGSGNVLQVQQMFHQCVEQLEEKDAAHQAVAVISLAFIAMSDDIGNQMCFRSLNHLMQFGNIVIKRAIPLAVAILNLSNPNIQAQDLLQKLAHDQDNEVSMRAILCLGLIGFGTNNSRLAGNLRQLSAYYNRETHVNHLFCVRVAMGLLHAGKGLVTIQPYYSDRFLFSHVSMAGVFILINSLLDVENLILGKYHYLLYYLALSIYPRMLFTLDENLENLPVNVRVGQAIDTVGQAGQPKRITGFQTHISPVILAHGERAELGTDEYIPAIDSVLENFVILKKNPDYQMEIEEKK